MRHVSILRRGLLLALLTTGGLTARAQTGSVGIGTTAPDASAALDIVSTGKGALLPRVASVARIDTPATGLIVFQTGGTAGFYYNAGTPATPSWQQLNVVGGAGDNLGNHTATQALNLQGNALTGTGASISGVGLGIRADGGLNLGQNTPGNNIYLGTRAGAGATGSTGRNTFLGYEAGNFAGPASNNNLFLGFRAGYSGSGGGFNTFLGGFSGYRTSGGSSNVFVGYNGGYHNTSGSKNTALGDNSGPADGSGAITNATALGADVTLTQSNTVVLGSGASVGIGTSAPAASAKLEVSSTTQGFLPPRLTASQRDGIASPTAGLLVFQTDGTQGIYYYTGVAWVNLTNGRTPDANGSTVPANGAAVSTLAGTAGSAGGADGPGAAARFTLPSSVAVDAAGTVYVADLGNHTIRRITAAGAVSTLAGTAGSFGSADGTGAAARFNNPSGVAVDAAGAVYVADQSNHTIRVIK